MLISMTQSKPKKLFDFEDLGGNGTSSFDSSEEMNQDENQKNDIYNLTDSVNG